MSAQLQVATGGTADGLCHVCQRSFNAGQALVVLACPDDPGVLVHLHQHCHLPIDREAVIRDMLAAWEDQHGEGACDCRPEPENAGHVCCWCLARLALKEGVR